MTSSYPANSTCWAGCFSPADWNKTSSLYFCKWKLCKCSDLCNHLFLWFLYLFGSFLSYTGCVWYCLQTLKTSLFFPGSSFVLFLIICPICCMGRGWHWRTACSRLCLSRTVGIANFTYIYATRLSTLYSLCLVVYIYTTCWIKYLYKGVL